MASSRPTSLSSCSTMAAVGIGAATSPVGVTKPARRSSRPVSWSSFLSAVWSVQVSRKLTSIDSCAATSFCEHELASGPMATSLPIPTPESLPSRAATAARPPMNGAVGGMMTASDRAGGAAGGAAADAAGTEGNVAGGGADGVVNSAAPSANSDLFVVSVTLGSGWRGVDVTSVGVITLEGRPPLAISSSLDPQSLASALLAALNFAVIGLASFVTVVTCTLSSANETVAPESGRREPFSFAISIASYIESTGLPSASRCTTQ
mmetsp:Transcript_22463/g.57293  ORF Transcript_22463/g.57293 Transcript_22463/m.57293 type:complete len:264 (+) Transcript_22463:142-933(+)